MMSVVRSWARENATLIYFLIAQAGVSSVPIVAPENELHRHSRSHCAPVGDDIRICLTAVGRELNSICLLSDGQASVRLIESDRYYSDASHRRFCRTLFKSWSQIDNLHLEALRHFVDRR